MDILAIQDMEHVDALEFTRVTKQRFVQIQKLTALLADGQTLRMKDPNVPEHTGHTETN